MSLHDWTDVVWTEWLSRIDIQTIHILIIGDIYMLLELDNEVFQLLFDLKKPEECHKRFAARILTKEVYKLLAIKEMDQQEQHSQELESILKRYDD